MSFAHDPTVQTEADLPYGWTLWLTDAPEAYDGFGTRTVRPVVATTKNGDPVREVAISPDARDWQTARYFSGLRTCCLAGSEDARTLARLGFWQPATEGDTQ